MAGTPGRKQAKSTPRVALPARLPESTYATLAEASSVLNSSMNSVLDRAVTYYVSNGGLSADVAEARAKADEAIKKLSGEE